MSLDSLLDTCLSEIEAGQATVEECVARYPDLAPLLKLAAQLQAVPAPNPSPQFVQATRARLVSLPVSAGRVSTFPETVGASGRVVAGAVRPAARQPGRLRDLVRRVFSPVPALPRRWQPAFVGLVAAFVAVVVLGGGTVLASADAAPTSPLYPVKRVVEQAQLFLATTPERQALLHAEFARRRLREAVQVAALGQDDQAERLIKEYGRELETAVSLVEHAAARGTPVALLSDQILGQVEAQRSTVESARDTLPSRVVAGALTAASQAGNQLGNLRPDQGQTSTSTPAPSQTPSPIPPITTPSPPGFSVKDQQSTTVPPRATIVPAPLPTATRPPTTLPLRNTPVIVLFSSPTLPPTAPAPTATQPPVTSTPRPPTPTPPPGATEPEPSDTDTPQPTSTPRPHTPTVAPTNTKTPIVLPTPRPHTPTAVPTATQVPTTEPTATQLPTTEPTATQLPTTEPTATQLPTTEPTATQLPTTEPTPRPATPTSLPTEPPSPTPPVGVTDVVPTSPPGSPEPTAKMTR
jgi:hypothetical protein